MNKIIGVIPARMGASRFPGKPLAKILGRPMIEHVYARASLYEKWDNLSIATCDEEILNFTSSKGWPTIMTSNTHLRPLDRVAEATKNYDDNDIVVCVQGDEPMLRPDMIDAVIEPFFSDKDVECTVLSMHITEEKVYYDPDAVKLVYDINHDVLYTSRSPIPYSKNFSPELNAYRIYGILAFRNQYLQRYTSINPTPLEIKESCDSNRICGMGLKQRAVLYPFIPSYSVDTINGRDLVESAMPNDPLWGKY